MTGNASHRKKNMRLAYYKMGGQIIHRNEIFVDFKKPTLFSKTSFANNFFAKA